MAASRVAVVGGGITGLAAGLRLLALARETGRPLDLTILEAGRTLGGKVRTDRPQGLIIEQGPDSLLARKPWGVELCRRLGLADSLVGTGPAARHVYLVRAGRLEPMPEGLVLGAPTRATALLRTRLIPAAGKLRAALEPFIPARRDEEDESVAAFFRRRLGRAAAEAIAEPLLEAVYASNAERLSLLATYPQFRALERRYGSLVRGLGRQRAAQGPAAARDSSAQGPVAPNPAAAQGPISTFVTLRTGLGTLVEAAVAQLSHAPGTRLLAGTRVVEVAAGPGGTWTIATSDGHAERFDAVIITVPAFAAADLLAPFAAGAAAHLAAIPYASTAAVALAFPRRALARPLDASGFLVPRREARVITGCTWLSAKWPHTAPDDIALLRCFVGRHGHEDALALPDDELTAAVIADLKGYMDLRGEPLLTRVYRWPRAMPQYEVGHLERVAAVERELADHPTLALAGAGLRGIGVPDCIRQGEEAADRIAGALGWHVR